MDVRSLQAAQGYAVTRSSGQGAPGVDTTGTLAKTFAQTLREGEDVAKQAMVGGADPQSLVQALTETQLAVETAVTIRDRVVEAYQEILRMPV